MQGASEHHPNLTSLILHHATCVDHLPCTLSLGATNLISDFKSAEAMDPATISDDDSDMDDEEMYRHLAKLNILKP